MDRVVQRTGVIQTDEANSRCNAVGCWCIRRIADDDTCVEDVDVQRMVDHVHMIGGIQRALDTVDTARERCVGDTERRLPYLAKQRQYMAENFGCVQDLPSQTLVRCTARYGLYQPLHLRKR